MAQLLKESACNEGDPGSIPRLGRSPGEGNSNPLQYSCLGNPMVRGLGSYSPWGCQESGTSEWLAHTHTHTHCFIFIPQFLLCCILFLFSFKSSLISLRTSFWPVAHLDVHHLISKYSEIFLLLFSYLFLALSYYCQRAYFLWFLFLKIS